jgi:hypothetical protein
MFNSIKQIFTKKFYKEDVQDLFQVLDVEENTIRKGLSITIKLIRKTKRFGIEDIETEIVVYDNVHRQTSSGVFFTYCPYTHDRRFMDALTFNHGGWGYLYNNDSTEHSFIKLSKSDIERGVDNYCINEGISIQGNWN